MGNKLTTTRANKNKKAKPTLVYWNLHGRGDFCQAMLYAGGIEYDLDDATANTWPAPKDEAPFGQLPYFKHGDLTLAQNGAITRYCARLAGIYPTDPVEASKCDMYIEEVMDIFNEIFKVRPMFGIDTFAILNIHSYLNLSLLFSNYIPLRPRQNELTANKPNWISGKGSKMNSFLLTSLSWRSILLIVARTFWVETK